MKPKRSNPFITIRFLFFCILLSVSPWGCSFLKSVIGQEPKRPTFSLQGLRITNFKDLSVDCEVTLKVVNPNDFDVQFENLVYEVTTTEGVLVQGSKSEPITLKAMTEDNIDLPFTLNTSYVFSTLISRLKSKTPLDLSWKAQADVDTPMGFIKSSAKGNKLIILSL